MKLNIKKQIEQNQEIDLELPAFFLHHSMQIMICEDGTIVKGNELFSSLSRKGDFGYDRDLAEILSKGKPSSSHDFHECLQCYLDRVATQTGYSVNLYLISEPETV